MEVDPQRKSMFLVDLSQKSLIALGIGNPMLSWISFYIMNKSKEMKIRQYTSKIIKITPDVPQRRQLSPLLFL